MTYRTFCGDQFSSKENHRHHKNSSMHPWTKPALLRLWTTKSLRISMTRFQSNQNRPLDRGAVGCSFDYFLLYNNFINFQFCSWRSINSFLHSLQTLEFSKFQHQDQVFVKVCVSSHQRGQDVCTPFKFCASAQPLLQHARFQQCVDTDSTEWTLFTHLWLLLDDECWAWSKIWAA